MMTTITAHTQSETTARMPVSTRTLLLGAPLLMVVGRLLLVPLDDEDWDATLTSMAEHQGRSDAGWLLAIAACGLLAVTALVFTRRLAAVGRTRAAGIATVTTAIGWAATAAMCLGGIYLSVAADAPDRAAQVQIQENFNEATGPSVVFLMSVIGAVGYLVMAISLARAAIISKGAAALIAIGGVATLLTMVGPVTAVLVVSALLLTAGHALALRAQL